jgi:hypothetical protein
MGLMGVAFFGPALHFWYSRLDKIVKWPGAKGAAAKLALDQTLFAPFALTGFFGLLGLLEGDSPQQIWEEKFKPNFVPSLLANYTLWPAANFINFRVSTTTCE